MIQLQPCDIFFTAGDARLSRLIRWRTKGEVNHVGLVVSPGTIYTAEVVEALHPRALRHPMGVYTGRPDRVAVYRPTNLTPADIEAIVEAAKSFEGLRYGYAKIGLQALGLGGLSRVARWPICSYVVAIAFASRGYHFGDRSPRAKTPQCIWRFCSNFSDDRYRLIRPLMPIPEPEADTMESWPTPSSALASATHRR